MKQRLTIQAKLSELAILREQVGSFIGDVLDETDRNRVILAIDEAVANIIIHGYKNDENNSVEIEMESSPDSMSFIITDTAPEYNPLDNNRADFEKYYEEGANNGLGIDIYKRVMNVSYEYNKDGCNRLILMKEIKHEDQTVNNQ